MLYVIVYCCIVPSSFFSSCVGTVFVDCLIISSVLPCMFTVFSGKSTVYEKKMYIVRYLELEAFIHQGLFVRASNVYAK